MKRITSNKHIKLAEKYMDNVAQHYDPVPQESAIVDFAIWLDKQAAEHERLVNLAMQIVKGIMEKPKMDTKCKCGHSVFDHSEDTGCDAKGCTCSEGFEQVASEIFTKNETQIDNLYREVNLLKATNHRLGTEKDTDYDAALEWAASWVTGAQLSGHSEEVQEYAKNMAMSIRAAKRRLIVTTPPAKVAGGMVK